MENDPSCFVIILEYSMMERFDPSARHNLECYLNGASWKNLIPELIHIWREHGTGKFIPPSASCEVPSGKFDPPARHILSKHPWKFESCSRQFWSVSRKI
ncbi:hypothetical protein AVEN_229813-1 [Araneus ventricosus]|uniref:Uncharacterized protein n=1 Tax=Araneus ventricosus TaxID=182803 RepID=A0A4Y2T4Q5_ARAVE|nr:hypothetical protein AVEN_229813-1 [Araneus ventricosus]